MFRAIVVIALLARPALGAPCKTASACDAACDAGDPAACVVAVYEKAAPFKERLAELDHRCTELESSAACILVAAYQWAGVGTKVQKDVAIETWRDNCHEDDWYHCLVYAKAIERTRPADARETYRDICSERDSELACRAGGRMWERVRATTRHGAAFSVELPAVIKHYDVWGAGTWHVLWSASTMTPDVRIDDRNGVLECTAAPQSAGDPDGAYGDVVKRYAEKYRRYLPPDWAARICASLRKE
jgi:hypothetical protein